MVLLWNNDLSGYLLKFVFVLIAAPKPDYKRSINVSGNVILPHDVKLPLADGSCLNVYIQEEKFCINCTNPILGETKLLNPIVKDKRISYIMEAEISSINSVSYVLQATLNNGWCGNKEEWIRYNDFKNEYSHTVQVLEGMNNVQKDVKVDRYALRK